jgi:hypothetical protein
MKTNRPDLKITSVADVPHPIRGGQEWPVNVCKDDVSCTLNTRYDGMQQPEDFLSLAHYPKTVVLVEYD